MDSVSLDSGWRQAEWECGCGWSGPGSATAYRIEETRAVHACPFCATELFQVVFYVSDDTGGRPAGEDPEGWAPGE